MNRLLAVRTGSLAGVPRVSGDEPVGDTVVSLDNGSSPRKRG